jgi:serine/threonine protein kinase
LLVAQLAATLEALHRHGVLHLDLKPSNTLIEAGGRPRLLDFGLALLAQPWEQPRLDNSGISGTLHYMAPEQASGRAEQLGPRTDVFGLGAILYELLTGRRPYDADSLGKLLEQARQAQVIPPREIRRRVPRSLEQICLKALAHDTDDRHASAQQLEHELRGYLQRRHLFAAAAFVALVLAAMAVPFIRPFPNPPVRQSIVAPRAELALDGSLILRVWTPDNGPAGPIKRGLIIGEVDTGALPVRNGESVHLEVQLNQPAFIYLLWVDGEGHVQPLYPWDPERGLSASPGSQTRHQFLDSPPKRARAGP